MDQVKLDEFGRSAGDERPDEEAVHVAGSDDVAVADIIDPDATRYPDPAGVVEMAVTQVDYTLVGRGVDERPVMHVFGRTRDDALVQVRVHEFQPYFYVPTDSLDEGDLDVDGIVGSEETDAEGEPYRSIRGERLTKVFGRTPRDVGQVRDRFEHYEADILFPNRFLIDKDVRSGIRVPGRWADDGVIDVPHQEVEAVAVTEPSLRVHTMDIEVEDRHGFPEDGEEPIVCLTGHDSARNEYVAWLFDAPDGDAPLPVHLDGFDLIADGGDASVEVRSFDAEAAMLADYLDYLDDTDPDVMCGWNFEDFDAPYLIDRLDRLDPASEFDLDSNRLSRVNEVWDGGWGGPNVKGRVVFDLLYAYKQTQFSELDSYRLDAVAETELGVGKERYPGDVGDLWEDDPERLLEYNLRDVELCVEIDRKQQVVSFWREVASFVGCKLEDATTAGDAVDMYVLHKAHGNFALPSKGQQESGEEFEGGAVFDPITGVREMVTVLDLKSLYPMSMATINASPETKVEPERYDGETYRAPNGTHFRREPDGMMREMIDELLAERDAKKDARDEHDPGSVAYQRFDQQQQAVKRVMNSLYGVSGWERFRLYDKDAAAAITATGRAVIEFTESVANEMGYEVAYGDTDSVMIELGNDYSKEAAIETSFDIESNINDRYGEFAESLHATEHRFQIEFEKLYRRFFQAGTKKRYAGYIVWKEGKDVGDVDITGFEYKRSDIAPITKEVQQRVIEMIVTGAELDDVKAYVHDVVVEFETGNVELDDVGIPGGIGKRLNDYDTASAHVRGAKYANLLLGTNFARGSKPKHLYLRKVHPGFFRRMEDERGLDPQSDPLYGEFKRNPDVICFEYADQVPESFEVDWEKMLDKTLKGPISRVLDALDVSWEEVRSGQTQTGLGSFS